MHQSPPLRRLHGQKNCFCGGLGWQSERLRRLKIHRVSFATELLLVIAGQSNAEGFGSEAVDPLTGIDYFRAALQQSCG